MNKITHKNLKEFSKKFNKKRTNKVFKNVNTKGSFKNLIIKADHLQNKKYNFSNEINIKTDITDQKNSGRCWMFAFLNIIRLEMIKKYNLENFEFSENYLLFYDKLEKANFFFNYIIGSLSKNINDNELIFMLSNVTSDGNKWNMFKRHLYVLRQYRKLSGRLLSFPEALLFTVTHFILAFYYRVAKRGL